MPRFAPALILLLAASAPAQPSQQPQVRVNVLNVCNPSDEEQKELTNALAALPRKPAFALDFEVSRGRSTMNAATTQLEGITADPNAPPANWVRIRREFSAGDYSNVQYSISVEGGSVTETLVFRVRDPKEVLQVSIQDTARGSAASVLATNTPANRVKVERFGKSSVALARCPTADQRQYEPIFRTASEVIAKYRAALDVRRTAGADLVRLGVKDAKPVTLPAREPRQKKDVP